MTLVEFLIARLAEDEAVAGAATPGPWHHDPVRDDEPGRLEVVLAGETILASTGPSTGPGADAQSAPDAAHIARHDPARILREVAVKRRIVELHRSGVAWNPILGDCVVCAFEEQASEDSDGEVSYYRSSEGWPCPTIRALASVYADHPDFDQAWVVV